MKRILLLPFLLVLFSIPSIACTTVIVSGKYTADGRPLMWKVRDSDYALNSMMYFNDGLYHSIGLINSEDKEGKQVWGGTNSAGFSIMNSASFNVNLDDTSSKKDLEGYFMRKALQSCATLSDFEDLLRSTPKPMGLAAHFGVIDAKGGAAFYEVNNNNFTKFDANDSAVAPFGYILRTNFSFTGKKDVGYGFVRYQTAQDLLIDADGRGAINARTFIQEFSRCFINPITKSNFRNEYEKIPEGKHFVICDDLITRSETTSTILVHGVKAGESPDFSTLWTLIGFPNTCLALPVWVKGGNLPKVLTRDASGTCPLNSMSLELKKQCFPITRSGGERYLQISKLINLEKSGFVQRIELVEGEIFKKTEEKLQLWREGKGKPEDMGLYYTWLDNLVYKTYSQEFGLTVQ